MKKIFIALSFLLACQYGFSQILYDNGGISDASQTGQFTIQGNSWNHRIITYFFQNVTNDFNSTAARGSVREAFKTWQAQANISFIEVCSASNADIIILFASGNHGDASPFDGTNGVLAHAFFPPPNSGSLAGDVHFDEDENWTNIIQSGSFQPIDLQTVALHEIGHSLGLNHTNISNAVMFAFYNGSHRNLEQDDINGIRAIYGIPATFLSGPASVVGTANFTLREPLPTGCNISWTSNVSCVSLTANGTGITVSSLLYSGVVTLTANISSGCGTLQFSREIQIAPSSSSFAINGPAIICSGNSSIYTISGLPAGYAVAWSSSNNSAATLTPIGNKVNVSATGAGTLVLTATITNNACGGQPIIVTKSISIGYSYMNAYVSGSTQDYPLGDYRYDLIVPYGRSISNISWILPPTWSVWFGENTQSLYVHVGTISGAVQANFDDECGNHTGRYITVNVSNAGGGGVALKSIPVSTIDLMPNPSTGQFNILLKPNNKTAFIKEVIISTKMGAVIYRQKFNGNQQIQTINLFNQPTDVYTVQVFDGTNWSTKKLNLQR